MSTTPAATASSSPPTRHRHLLPRGHPRLAGRCGHDFYGALVPLRLRDVGYGWFTVWIRSPETCTRCTRRPRRIVLCPVRWRPRACPVPPLSAGRGPACANPRGSRARQPAHTLPGRGVGGAVPLSARGEPLSQRL